MGHNVGDQANRAVKKGERKQVEDKRTPEQRLADIRKNLDAKLFVTPDDQRWLLRQYDEIHAILTALKHNTAAKIAEMTTANFDAMTAANQEIDNLKAQIEQFRTVYEQENRSVAVEIEQVVDQGGVFEESNENS
jgi:DNA-binding FadR family transcriptional regulator